MLSRSSLARSALPCAGMFIVDFTLKLFAPSVAPGVEPAANQIYAYAGFRAVVEALPNGTILPICFALQAAMTCGFVPMFLSSILIFYSTHARPDGGFVFLFFLTSILAYLGLSLISLTVGMV